MENRDAEQDTTGKDRRTADQIPLLDDEGYFLPTEPADAPAGGAEEPERQVAEDEDVLFLDQAFGSAQLAFEPFGMIA